MDWIASRFQDCLCPICLEKVGAGDVELVSRKPSTPTQAESTESS